MAGFRAFYDNFYDAPYLCRTTADGMRKVVRAYKAFRRHNGFADTLHDSAREASYAARMEYHIGACELAEFAGDALCVAKHRAAFMHVWKRWYWAISDEEAENALRRAASKTAPIGFWEAVVQTLKQRRS